MKDRLTKATMAALIGVAALGACSRQAESPAQEPAPVAAAPSAETVLPNGLTVKVQVETRQAQLKKMGKAFKAISDQLKSGQPDLDTIQMAAASLQIESAGMEDWFPEGTGPETGVKTDALPAIWEDRADFEQKLADFRTASDALVGAAASGDMAVIGDAFGVTGGACKACHDKFRQDD